MGKKVYFKYGVMGSAKSLDLIRAEYNYRERGMETIVFIPKIDTRSNSNVLSRLGVNVPAIQISSSDNVYDIVAREVNLKKRKIKAVFIDEVHFLAEEHIDQITDIADFIGIPVLCYGLRTDFRNKLFKASKRLLEVADELEEIKAMCDCGRKAICTARFVDGVPVNKGDQIFIGDQEYKSFCRTCYKNLFNKN